MSPSRPMDTLSTLSYLLKLQKFHTLSSAKEENLDLLWIQTSIVKPSPRILLYNTTLIKMQPFSNHFQKQRNERTLQSMAWLWFQRAVSFSLGFRRFCLGRLLHHPGKNLPLIRTSARQSKHPVTMFLSHLFLNFSLRLHSRATLTQPEINKFLQVEHLPSYRHSSPSWKNPQRLFSETHSNLSHTDCSIRKLNSYIVTKLNARESDPTFIFPGSSDKTQWNPCKQQPNRLIYLTLTPAGLTWRFVQAADQHRETALRISAQPVGWYSLIC